MTFRQLCPMSQFAPRGLAIQGPTTFSLHLNHTWNWSETTSIRLFLVSCFGQHPNVLNCPNEPGVGKCTRVQQHLLGSISLPQRSPQIQSQSRQRGWAQRHLQWRGQSSRWSYLQTAEWEPGDQERKRRGLTFTVSSKEALVTLDAQTHFNE